MLYNEKNTGLEIIKWDSCPSSITHHLCGAEKLNSNDKNNNSSDQLVSTD